MIDMLCEKCEEEAIGWFAPRTRLVGGVSTNLCPGCVTKWNKHTSHHTAFQRLRVLECVRSSIVFARELPMNSVDPELTVILTEFQECEDVLHEEGLKWLGRMNTGGKPDES